MSYWTDKNVLVTGASSGLGLATAGLAAAAGAHVALVARDERRLEAARASVSAQCTGDSQRVLSYSCDVADPHAVEDVVDRVIAELGPVDVLAACAGFCEPRRFIETPAEEFQRHLDVNLLGSVYAAKAVVPSMIERGRGHIGLVSSMGGLVGVYGYSAYSTAKFGVTGLAEVLRCELRPHGVGVTLLCPPNMDTPGYAREVATEPRETAAINGMAKTVDPSEVAREFLRGIERGRFLLLHGMSNRLLYRIGGLWPELFYRIFDGKVAAVRREEVRSDDVH